MTIPVASFSFTFINLTVSFTDTSTNTPTSWSWDFGDGNTSTSQNPIHTYATTGEYSIGLIATNDSGSSPIHYKSSVLNWAIFTSSPDPQILNSSVSFTELDLPTVYPSQFPSWIRSWDFGDGGTSSSVNPTHSYTTGGTYTVQLTSVVGGCDAPFGDPPTPQQRWSYAGENTTYVATLDVHITAPDAAFTVTGAGNSVDNPQITGTAVTFTDQSTGSPSAWSWDFGDGNSSTDQNPTHSYSTAGTYTVTLTVS